MDNDFSQIFSDLLSSCNDIFNTNYVDEENDLSQLFHETKSHALSCEERPVSNTEVKPASSDCHDKKTTVYLCSVCDKTFSRNCNLIQHMVIHKQKTAIYSCSTCGKSFSRNQYLKRHMHTHTLTEKSALYECSTCGKTFKRNRYLRHHMKMTHSEEKMFSYKVCLKPFLAKNSLKRH